MGDTHTPSEPQATIDPLSQRGIEVEVAAAFLAAAQERVGEHVAEQLFDDAVRALAEKGAARFRERYPDATLASLWDVWGVLGGDGRLHLVLDELTDGVLRFHVDHCSYADLYRSRGLGEVGVAFSCRRDAPFAEAFLPGVVVEQSKTILEGAIRCEFTYTLEGS
jgi:predicted ArsR family transcriptional regulator